MIAIALPSLVLGLSLLVPPSGRPPTGPLERYEPRLYEVTFGVVISTEATDNPVRDPRYEGNFDLRDAPIVMPIILHGAYSKTLGETLSPRLWLAGQEDNGFAKRSRLDEGFPFFTHKQVMPIAQFQGKTLRWELRWSEQVWSSKINDAEAAKLTWPKDWPAEVADGLKPQKYIESDDEIFAQTVENITHGKARMVPPYLCAKELIRSVIGKWQQTGSETARGAFSAIRGLRVVGAKQAWSEGRGNANDLVCVCVAVLRAAGIPARPVIGISDQIKGKSDFVVWAEFYLPEAGWVPFDPDEMRGKGIDHKDLRTAWPGFGTLDDLNERLPLSYYFIPPASVQTPGFPAVWGWDPRPHGNDTAQQTVTFQITNRGKGEEDPR